MMGKQISKEMWKSHEIFKVTMVKVTQIPWNLQGYNAEGRNSTQMGDFPNTRFSIHPTAYLPIMFNTKLR